MHATDHRQSTLPAWSRIANVHLQTGFVLQLDGRSVLTQFFAPMDQSVSIAADFSEKNVQSGSELSD